MCNTDPSPHGREAVCATLIPLSHPWEESLVYAQSVPHPWEESLVYAQSVPTTMGGEPGLCAEASQPPWEESLVYAQRPLTHHRRAWSMRRGL